jgi:excisionase family DNA binding protein
MKIVAGQLSLLELESPMSKDQPTVPARARHRRSQDDKPAENVVSGERPRTPTKRPGVRRASHEAGLLTTHEAAARLHVHPRTVQRLVERGHLCAIHLGSAVRFDPDDIDALITAVKERRHIRAADTVRVRRSATTSSFADRLRSQRDEHRATQA